MKPGYRTLHDVISRATTEYVPFFEEKVEKAEAEVRKNREELARLMEIESQLTMLVSRHQHANKNSVQVYSTPPKSMPQAIGSRVKKMVFGKGSLVADAAYEENIGTRITKEGELIKTAYELLDKKEPLPEYMSTSEIAEDLIHQLKLKESTLHKESYTLNKHHTESRSHCNLIIEELSSMTRILLRTMRNILTAAS